MKTFSLLLPQVRFMKAFSFRLPILKTFTLKNLLPQSQIMKTLSVLAAAKSIYENVFISLLQNRFMKTFSSRNIYVNTYIHKYVNTYIHTGHIFYVVNILVKAKKFSQKWEKVRESVKK